MGWDGVGSGRVGSAGVGWGVVGRIITFTFLHTHTHTPARQPHHLTCCPADISTSLSSSGTAGVGWGGVGRGGVRWRGGWGGAGRGGMGWDNKECLNGAETQMGSGAE